MVLLESSNLLLITPPPPRYTCINIISMNNWTKLFLFWLTLIAMDVHAQNTINSTSPVGIGTFGAASAGLHVKQQCGTDAFKANVLFEGQTVTANLNGQGCTPTNLNNIPVTGDGSRWMWLSDRAAVRSGVAFGTEWDDYSQIGTATFVNGFASNAISPASTALGWNARVGGTDPLQGLAGFAFGSNVYTDPGGVVIGAGGFPNVSITSQLNGDPRDSSYYNVMVLGENYVLNNDVFGSIMFGSGSVNPTMILTRAPATDGFGNVGIATKTPGSALQVNGGAAIGYSAATAAPTNGLAVAGAVGVGTSSPFWPLEVKSSNFHGLLLRRTNVNGGTAVGSQITFLHDSTQLWALGTDYASNGVPNFFIYGGDGSNNTSRLSISPQGVVGIGVSPIDSLPSGYKLHVNGNVRCKKAVVETANWPDYVFDFSYPLLPFADLRSYLAQNQHLPNIPSASEIEANGLDLGEVQKQMMEKIEEQALYILQLEERLQKIEQRLSTR
jgi:hypothetical protein